MSDQTTDRITQIERLLLQMAESQTAFQRTVTERDGQREQEMTYLFDVVNHLVSVNQDQIEQAAIDRNQAAIDRAEFRTTVNSLLEVLTARFTSNGHGDRDV